MRTSSLAKILEAAIAVAGSDDGDRLTLEAVATEAGLTKPGLMYHFPSKKALMRGVVAHLADQWVRLMTSYLPVSVGEATSHMRLVAYVEAATSDEYSRSDFTIYALASRSSELSSIWRDRMDSWIAMPASLSDEERARVVTARLAADGYWFTKSTEMLTPGPEDRARVRATILQSLDQLSN